ncbi:HAD-IIB family hydrolase [Tuanshanicoccus lijuaniae]|uniref:HAD-IIB family hydrolase n=1 Tax=Aerococcaceae bacterium zg-1292 TaxID=2774330 RepID=UPI001BD8BB41|nr:HAD-IIB family hydrolase [Aerococcaceae bacterium zg-BR9]MBS4455974.1 HAD-IIB family hydrolase [Aerococcaceae bacterium zg-A91]MBS4457726.1 HAD-IIB family hydrolase [Aerococcaceae bacterium zg-BR33]
MIKLFLTDLDGTLLNKWHTADSVINQGVKEVERRGYQLAVVTGRHLRHHQRFGLGFLQHTNYMISMNGALVSECSGKVIAMTSIQPEAVLQLSAQFPEISFEYLTPETTYVVEKRTQHFVKGFKKQWSGKNISRAILNLTFGRFEYEQAVENIVAQPILKIECITNTNDSKQRLIQYLDAHNDDFSYAYNDNVHFEITGKGVNKRKGALQLIKHLSLHPDQVMVYGNDSNDEAMLAYFNHSVAPSSAAEVALKNAKEIIGEADEHAVINHILMTVRKQDRY